MATGRARRENPMLVDRLLLGRRENRPTETYSRRHEACSCYNGHLRTSFFLFNQVTLDLALRNVADRYPETAPQTFAGAKAWDKSRPS